METEFLKYMTEAKGIFTMNFNIPALCLSILSEDDNYIIFMVSGLTITKQEKKAKIKIKKGR